MRLLHRFGSARIVIFSDTPTRAGAFSALRFAAQGAQTLTCFIAANP
jgi:hypothetical protein